MVTFPLYTSTAEKIATPPPALSSKEQADEVAQVIEQNSEVVLIKQECFLLSFPGQVGQILTWMPCPPHFEPEDAE
jgi:hypothetical protein